MFDKNKLKNLAHALLPAVYRAGEAILEVSRQTRIEVGTKENASPVTVADKRAEAILLEALGQVLPDIPVIAEEQAEVRGLPRKGFAEFFLVDPLDGTKEFISKASYFTVNVALIQSGKPVFGLVYAPAMEILYIGLSPGGAFKIEGDHGGWAPISVREKAKPLTLVASKSHQNRETRDYLAHYPGAEVVNIGSSLKFCLVAEGKADLYPRLGPTMEWDTAAGHAVLVAAGGAVFNPDGTPFVYNKEGFKNGFFIARGDEAIDFKKV